jgi:hypothetical protein
MRFTLQPVRVGNGSDEEGLLVFTDDERLVAVLTHLSERYEDVAGDWPDGRANAPDLPGSRGGPGLDP